MPVSKFAAYVTSTAFHLSLSKPMILNLEFIQWCTNHPDEYGGYPSSLDRWGNASTVNALIERGLIERIQTDAKSHVQTTQAGQMVLRLCALAGLTGTYDADLKLFNPPADIPAPVVTPRVPA